MPRIQEQLLAVHVTFAGFPGPAASTPASISVPDSEWVPVDAGDSSGGEACADMPELISPPLPPPQTRTYDGGDPETWTPPPGWRGPGDPMTPDVASDPENPKTVFQLSDFVEHYEDPGFVGPRYLERRDPRE